MLTFLSHAGAIQEKRKKDLESEFRFESPGRMDTLSQSEQFAAQSIRKQLL